MLIRDILSYRFEPLFVDLSAIVNNRFSVLGKLESLNPGGSIKLKPALALFAAVERRRSLPPNGGIIEATSGNMGIALSLVARHKKKRFVCVTDEKMTEHNRKLIRAYSAELVVLPKSTLRDRVAYIEERVAHDPGLVWTRQFFDLENPAAHASVTGEELLTLEYQIDYLFVGVGTGGTIAGCARTLRRHACTTKIVAVDAEGSAHFGWPPRSCTPRRIPGIGATERSAFLDEVQVDDVVVVAEGDTVSACLRIRDETGWLLGGSSGSVAAAVMKLSSRIHDSATVVAVCADSGERYLDTIYDVEWRRSHFPHLHERESSTDIFA